jgi:NADH-quinone oxidoreductase subunit A
MSLELTLSSIIFFVLAFGIAGVFIATKFLGPRNPNHKIKNLVYESGITNPVGSPDAPFSVKFYIVAILFVIFDVEIAFMLPWAVNVRELGYFGIFEMFLFITLLFAGLIYIYLKKALKWH